MKIKTSIFVSFFFLILFSCSNNENKKVNYILYPDSSNYDYFRSKNNLIKVVRFFPGTKDTNTILFWDTVKYIKDSVFYVFRQNGSLQMSIRYENEGKYKIRKDYKEDGTIDFILYGINNKPLITKYYYKSGNLKEYREFRNKFNQWDLNNNIKFYKNGKINRDSTLFFSILSTKDTINFNDSIKLNFIILTPADVPFDIITGNFDKNFYTEKNNTKIKYINNKVYYYKPKKTGNDTIRFVLKTYNLKDSIMIPLFLEKHFYVKE